MAATATSAGTSSRAKAGRRSRSAAGNQEQGPSENGKLTLYVTLIDPHEIGRRGLQEMLRALSFVKDVSSLDGPGDSVVELSHDADDIVILSTDVGRSEVEAVIAHAQSTGAKVLLMVRSAEPGHISAATRYAAHGFLIEPDLTSFELERALRDVAKGQMPMPTSVARQLLSTARATIEPPRTTAIFLTPREQQVLSLLADGLSNKQIARRLAISEHGAKRHVANVLAKLNCPNRTLAVAVAMRDGLLEAITIA